MAVFDDMETKHKLRIYDKGVVSNTLLTRAGQVVFPQVPLAEPLLLECQEFIECMRERRRPLSDARLGLQVVEALEAAQQSMGNEKNKF